MCTRFAAYQLDINTTTTAITASIERDALDLKLTFCGERPQLTSTDTIVVPIDSEEIEAISVRLTNSTGAKLYARCIDGQGEPRDFTEEEDLLICELTVPDAEETWALEVSREPFQPRVAEISPRLTIKKTGGDT